MEAPQNHGDRSSHFTIGSDEPVMAKNTYQSEFKEKYPQHALAQKQTVKKSNDENNIVLGFGDKQPLTNYREEYSQKAAEKVKQVNQRVVNVDLGDTLTDFTTSYHKAYDGSQGGRPDRLTAAPASIVLGYDPNAYTTSNAASHNAKALPNSKAPARNYGTNIVLGGDGPHFHSEHKAQFAHKDSTKESVDKQRVLDFKSAHFKFGFPEQAEANISEAQAHYSEKPLTIVAAEGAKPTNIELKHDNNHYFTSSYGQDFQLKKGEKAELLNKNGRNSSVVIGMGTETYQTEAKDQFVAKAVDRVRGKGTEGSLDLGGGERTFETQYQNTFTNKFDQREGNRVSKAEIDKMRAENFVKGFSGTPPVSQDPTTSCTPNRTASRAEKARSCRGR